MFRPELVGRFDEKVVFKPLSPDAQREIGRFVISEELDRFREQGFDLAVSEEVFEFLVRRGMHKTLGPVFDTLEARKKQESFIDAGLRAAGDVGVENVVQLLLSRSAFVLITG